MGIAQEKLLRRFKMSKQFAVDFIEASREEASAL
ncbi:GNAT family N-acetyltransferase, partial [Streptococcus agalactiae]|nr:GNAT family N-acetyltransferase [Streptococcus agalactiae]